VGRQVVERRSEAAGREEGALRASADGKGKRETGIPIVLMYGENDWMDVTGGHAAVEKINEEKKKAVEAARKEGRSTVDGGEAKVVIIKKAGHHLYLDGWEEFNSVMLEEMADVRRRETEREKGQNTGAGAS
jgi:cardiolipin-specific phospholipase